MSIDTDERFAAELSGQLRRIATDLTPGVDVETAVGVRAAARARRRTAARATAGVGLVLLVVAGIGWVGTRPTEPAEPTNPSGFSAPDVVYPVIDEALLPADLRGQLQPDVSTTDPGQWTGTLTTADGRTDSMVIAVMRPSSDSSPLDGDTPRRDDVTEVEVGGRGTHLEFRRDGFDLRLVSFDVDFAYSLVDRIVPSTAGLELTEAATAPSAVWLTRPYEISTSAAALYSDEPNALDVTVEQMPISLIRRFLCAPSTNSPLTCTTTGGNSGVLVELDETHTLAVWSNRLSTEELSGIAAGVRFVTFDEWNADGLPAPIDPDAIWPLVDEAAVPDRLASDVEAQLVDRQFPSITGAIGTLDAEGNPLSLTLVFVHPPFGPREPGELPFDQVPGRREGVTEATADGTTILTMVVGNWELNVIGADIDQLYAVLDAVDVVKDEHGVVNTYLVSQLPNGLQQLSVPTFLPVGSGPMVFLGDSHPAKITMLPLPVMAAATGSGGRSAHATTINGRAAYEWTAPDGQHSIAVAVTSTDTMVVQGDDTVTEQELLAITEGVTFGTQAEWEARYDVTVAALEQEMPTATEPG
jgi:hypothetical protein